MKRCVISLLLLIVVTAVRAYNFAEFAKYDSVWSSLIIEKGLPIQYKYFPLLLTDMDEHFQNQYAAGMWALSVPVAHHYGLRITADYDERYNIILSTKAAVDYLKDLSVCYPGNYQKVQKTYANMSNQFTDSAIRYSAQTPNIKISIMLGYMETMYKEDKKQIYVAADSLGILPFEIEVENNIKISDFCSQLQLEENDFLKQNPAIKPTATILRTGYRVYVPQEKSESYIQQKEKLYAQAQVVEVAKVTQPTVAPPPPPPFVVYRVKSGDTLGHIAVNYHVSVSQIKKWNGLRSDMLQIGQKIKIYK